MNATQINCPHCGRRLELAEVQLGGQARCKHCGRSFPIDMERTARTGRPESPIGPDSPTGSGSPTGSDSATGSMTGPISRIMSRDGSLLIQPQLEAKMSCLSQHLRTLQSGTEIAMEITLGEGSEKTTLLCFDEGGGVELLGPE